MRTRYYCMYHKCYLVKLKRKCIRLGTKKKKRKICKHLIILHEEKKNEQIKRHETN